MGLDWERASLSDYMEAIEANNERMAPDKGAHEPASPEFQEQMKGIFAAERAKKT